MKFVSFCSGIEAASLAWLPLGWQCVGVSEVDPFACAVLKHHYPTVPNLGDMTELSAAQLNQLAPDIAVAGCPCQSFSVAGLRNGLNDDRGNLTLTYVKLIRSIRTLRWALYENVPGILSDKTNAFGCLLAGLVGADAALVPAKGQRWTDAGVVAGPCGVASFRTIDAQFFGVAQRRRRVFVLLSVGAGNWASAQALFPQREGVRRNTAPRRETGESLAPTISARIKVGGGLGTDAECDGALVPQITPPIAGCSNHGGSNGSGRTVDDCEAPIPIQEIGKRQSGTPENGTGYGQPGDPMFTLQANAQHGITCPLTSNPYGDHESRESLLVMAHGQGNAEIVSDGGPSLTCNHEAPIAFQPRYFTRDNKTGGKPNEVAATVESGKRNGDSQQCVAFQPRIGRNGRGDMGDQVNALQAQSGMTGKGDAAPCVAFPQNLSATQYASSENLSPNIQAKNPTAVASGWCVRRLMPVETERLQGMPDDYTLIPGRKPADGPRYKVIGNSFAVPCVRWIGERIQTVETNSH